MILQGGVEERGDDEESEHPDHRRDELDDQQVRPGHRRVLDALVDADDGVLAYEREQPEALLLASERLRPPRRGHRL